MIVRISRATVLRDHEAAVFEALRAAVGSDRHQTPGLEAFYITRRMAGDRNQLVAITAWRDVDSMAAALGPNWHEPAFLPSIDHLLADASVEHLESIAEAADLLALVG